MLPSDDVVISMLKRENELRLGLDVQKRFEEAERSGAKSDWMEVAAAVQLELLREFSVSEDALDAYRCAAIKHGISLYVKYNRAREGYLQVGSLAPNISLISVQHDGSTRSQLLLDNRPTSRPLIIIAGSLVSVLSPKLHARLLHCRSELTRVSCIVNRADHQHGILLLRFTVTSPWPGKSLANAMISPSCTLRRLTRQMNGRLAAVDTCRTILSYL